ncbi:MAG: hypoxanthine phosphoribosyltransferase [Acidobacteria bacterium]|nr:hypoxanthine phosphoribosyltransferase [Acidobacteriota bacterium]
MEKELKLVPILTTEQIQEKVTELAQKITEEYQDYFPLMVGILKGCFIFAADLLRQLEFPYEVDFLGTSSYGDSTTSSGVVKLTKDLDFNVENRHVLLIEDIVDTGLTLHYLCDILKRREPLSVNIVALVEKDIPRTVDLPVKYIGFKVPNVYVAGYGLDWKEQFRGLPYIAQVIE